jgi:hypothetical protein
VPFFSLACTILVRFGKFLEKVYCASASACAKHLCRLLCRSVTRYLVPLIGLSEQQYLWSLKSMYDAPCMAHVGAKASCVVRTVANSEIES